MQIKVDIREHTLIKLLKALNNDYGFNIDISVERLDLGDISIWNEGEELLLLERKGLNDLASSITDGRYAEQSYRLNGNSLHNHNIVYLIEGNISNYTGKWSRIKPGTLYTTMFSIQYFKGFSTIAKHGSLFQLLKALEKDKHCLDNLLYKTKKGQERRISRTSIANIIQYLFYQKSNVIKIDT